MARPTPADLDAIGAAWQPDPHASSTLGADAYTDPAWLDLELDAIFSRSWQWVCHVEQLREPGAYVTAQVAGHPVAITRAADGELNAFYNVCRHRAHQLLEGAGTTRRIVCPYHAWSYDLTGQLLGAPLTQDLIDFDVADICLHGVRVEEFAGFVYVNLDAEAVPLIEQSGTLIEELARVAPDIERLTFAHRLTYEIASDWKNVVDNFLECYHCPVAHKDFCTLVEMDTYEVVTDGIWSRQYAEAGKTANSAYDVEDASVTMQTVWWLWPNTCLLRFPGRPNFMVLQILPDGPGRTLETIDFYLEKPNRPQPRSRRSATSTMSCRSRTSRSSRASSGAWPRRPSKPDASSSSEGREARRTRPGDPSTPSTTSTASSSTRIVRRWSRAGVG